MTDEKQEYPDFESIVKECKRVIENNFDDYGNSWKKKGYSLRWWLDRLEKEIQEVKGERFDGTSASFIFELTDVINICAFMIDNIKNGRIEDINDLNDIYARTWRYSY